MTTPKTAGDAQSAVRPHQPVEPGGPVGDGGRGVPDTMPLTDPPACVPRSCAPPIGQVWALPPGPGCARYARAILGEALALAGAPRSVICDARLIVSELATNAHQHARDHGPTELWLYPEQPLDEAADGPDGTAGELVGEARCAVFDRHRGARLPGYSWTSGDYGRGLSIVNELSEGRWGMLRTRSRRFPHGPGKAVWFAIPVLLRLPADPPGSA
ncbi:ATP-binding protein [Actinomadura sp. SCN-SB]|uniref:ATP-binding protein n=1 Tax=Actinomadura sp. SCN-SB TaxID=3373092 RepID=UPI003752F0D8